MRNPYKLARRAYCTGCGLRFRLMHQLRDHRHTFRCGGDWRVADEILVNLGCLPVWKIETPHGYRPYRQSMKPKKKKLSVSLTLSKKMRIALNNAHQLERKEARNRVSSAGIRGHGGTGRHERLKIS